MTALAELLWTNNVDDYNSYTNRLTGQFKRLDVLNVHYRLPDLPGMITQNVFTDQDTLSVVKPMQGMQIRYTTDGTLPGKNSQELTGKLIINKSERIRLAAFTSAGAKGDVYDLNYQQQSLASPVEVNNTQPGLKCSYYKAFFKETKLISLANADSIFISNVIAVPQSVKAPSFAITYSGYIDVPADGVYSFFLTCDDGGVLKVADRETVNNDGLHSAIEKNGQVALKKGLQKFKLDFIEGGGGYTLKLKYSKDGSAPADLPSSWFRN
jgi:hexosaminidase